MYSLTGTYGHSVDFARPLEAFRLDRIRSATVLEEEVRDRGLDPADIEVPDLISRGILGDLNRQAKNK